MTSGRVENDFNVAGSDFATITADSATYNKADMPLKVTRYSGKQYPGRWGNLYLYKSKKLNATHDIHNFQRIIFDGTSLNPIHQQSAPPVQVLLLAYKTF
jgi:hypothetical protein